MIRIVYNKEYDAPLARNMLAMTDIEIVKLNPETGISSIVKRSHNSSGSPYKEQTQRYEFEGLSLKRQRTEMSQPNIYNNDSSSQIDALTQSIPLAMSQSCNRKD